MRPIPSPSRRNTANARSEPTRYLEPKGCERMTNRKLLELVAEGTGLEPAYPCGRRFSRAHKGLDLTTSSVLFRFIVSTCYFGRMNRKRIPYGTKLPVSFSSKELEEIRECTMIGEEFGRHAVAEGNKLRLHLPLCAFGGNISARWRASCLCGGAKHMVKASAVAKVLGGERTL